MNEENEYKRSGVIEEKEYQIHLYFIFGLIIITLTLIVIRILLYYYEIHPYIKESKDIDYLIFIEGMKNGLINFYDLIEFSDWPPYYLYFWYFIFFPMYLLPIEIGIYIWDAIRLSSVAYVFYNAKEIFENKKDLIIFYVLSSIGYCYDAYFNNANFLIIFFLFLSYKYFENDKKWIAGIFFTLATFKINSLIFIPVLLISRKIKFKDQIYFLIPFFLICIPYIIFPDYFMQMVNNWLHSDEEIQGVLFLDSITWKALQPSHLMFISLLILIFLANLENISLAKRKKLLRILLPSIILIYYIYLTIIAFFIPIILT